MKIIILCGGKGTRLFPVTRNIPKPLVKIKEKPMVDYIIKYFKKSELIICTGYKSNLIKDYLKNNHYTNYTIINSGDVDILDRLKDCEKHINDDFMVCYGDTIADINLLQLKEFHANHKKAATMCLYSLNSNFGIIKRNKSGLVTSFKEKKKNYQYINIGYFIFKKNIFDQIHSAKNWMNFLESLIRKEQLFSFLHRGIHITVNTMTELKIAEKKIKQYNFNLKDKGQV